MMSVIAGVVACMMITLLIISFFESNELDGAIGMTIWLLCIIGLVIFASSLVENIYA